MKTYTFLKDRRDNKWYSLKKFDFLNKTKKWDGGSNNKELIIGPYESDSSPHLYQS